MKRKSDNVVFHGGTVRREDRERLLGQRGCTVWFTGLSASGKSTIACALETRLTQAGHLVQVLDGDNVRHGLNGDLGFSDEDRTENIRRIAEVAALSVDAGLIVLTAFISPFRSDRARAREIVGADTFVEVFVDATIECCEERDPKGLYKRARAGEIPEFTGISSPYEPPERPDLRVPSGEVDVAACAELVERDLAARGFLAPPESAAGGAS